MKLVKLSLLALTMGIFVASCGNSNSTDSTKSGDTAIAQPATPPASPAPADTTHTATADTTNAAATTTTTTTMSDSKMEKKMEKKAK
jgi:hypothetical protein